MACKPIQNTSIEPFDLIWGARNIAAVLGRTEGQVHCLLARGGLPGAKRIGGKWCIARAKLAQLFDISEGSAK